MMMQLPFPESTVGDRARVKLQIDWDSSLASNRPDFNTGIDDVTAGVVRAIQITRGGDVESQANGTIVSGQLVTGLGVYDPKLGKITNVYDPDNPNSALFNTQPKGQWVRLSYQDTDGTLIPIWTGRLVEFEYVGGSILEAGYISIKASGVLLFVGKRKISLTRTTNTNSFTACRNILQESGIAAQNITTIPGYNVGLTTLPSFEVNNQTPLAALRDVMSAEDGYVVENAEGGVLLIPRNFRDYARQPKAVISDSFTPDTGKDLTYTQINGMTVPVLQPQISGLRKKKTTATVFNTFNAIVESSSMQDNQEIWDGTVEWAQDIILPDSVTVGGGSDTRSETSTAFIAKIVTAGRARQIKPFTTTNPVLMPGPTDTIITGGQTDVTVKPSDAIAHTIRVSEIELAREDRIAAKAKSVTFSDGVTLKVGRISDADFTIDWDMENNRYVVDHADPDSGYVNGVTFSDASQMSISVRYFKQQDTATVVFNNKTNHNFYIQDISRMTATNTVVMPPERLSFPTDNSNATSIGKFGVEEYPREPRFETNIDQNVSGKDVAEQWARSRLKVYGDIRTIMTTPIISPYRETIKHLVGLDLHDLIQVSLTNKTLLYQSGLFFVQNLSINVDPAPTAVGFYSFTYTLEPVGFSNNSTILGDNTKVGQTGKVLTWGPSGYQV